MCLATLDVAALVGPTCCELHGIECMSLTRIRASWAVTHGAPESDLSFAANVCLYGEYHTKPK